MQKFEISLNIDSANVRDWLADLFKVCYNGVVAAPLKGLISCCLKGKAGSP